MFSWGSGRAVSRMGDRPCPACLAPLDREGLTPSVCDCGGPPGREAGAPGRPEHCSERGSVYAVCSERGSVYAVCSERGSVYAVCSERGASTPCAQSAARLHRVLNALCDVDAVFSNNTPCSQSGPCPQCLPAKGAPAGQSGCWTPFPSGTEVLPCPCPPRAPLAPCPLPTP